MKTIKALSVAGASLAIFMFAGGLQAAPVSATAYSVTGTVDYAPPDSISFRPLKAGQVLAIGCTVRTGDDGKAVLRTTPGSAVELGNDTLLKINELAFQKAGGAVTERKARLELTSGVVNVLVDPSTPKVTDFQIQTPEGAAAARGTAYTVIVKDGKTYATVGEGKISAIAKPSLGSL